MIRHQLLHFSLTAKVLSERTDFNTLSRRHQCPDCQKTPAGKPLHQSCASPEKVQGSLTMLLSMKEQVKNEEKWSCADQANIHQSLKYTVNTIKTLPRERDTCEAHPHRS